MGKELSTAVLGVTSMIKGIRSTVAVTGSNVCSAENGRVVASPSEIRDTVEGVMVPPPRLSVMPRTSPPPPELAIVIFLLENQLIVLIRPITWRILTLRKPIQRNLQYRRPSSRGI